MRAKGAKRRGTAEKPDTHIFSVVVDLVELDFVAVLGSKLIVDGCHYAAGAAPCRPEVEDGELVLLDLFEGKPRRWSVMPRARKTSQRAARRQREDSQTERANVWTSMEVDEQRK